MDPQKNGSELWCLRSYIQTYNEDNIQTGDSEFKIRMVEFL